MKTASATIIPKTTPTMMNRLFISKIEATQIKRDALASSKDME